MPSSDSEHSRSSRKRKSSHRSSKSSRDRKRHRRSRSKSTSRSKDRRRDKERCRREKSRSPDHKQLNAEIASVKQKMREALSSAQNELKRHEPVEMKPHFSFTAMEEAQRSDDIKCIDSGNFNQAHFVSNRSAAVAEMDAEQISNTRQLNQHENAIFGTVRNVKDEDVQILEDVKPNYDVQIRREVNPLAHENLYEDENLRKARWRKKWTELRRQLIVKLKLAKVKSEQC